MGGGVFCKKVDLFSTQGALRRPLQYQYFYILLIWGVPTHPTHLPTYGPGFVCIVHQTPVVVDPTSPPTLPYLDITRRLGQPEPEYAKLNQSSVSVKRW